MRAQYCTSTVLLGKKTRLLYNVQLHLLPCIAKVLIRDPQVTGASHFPGRHPIQNLHAVGCHSVIFCCQEYMLRFEFGRLQVSWDSSELAARTVQNQWRISKKSLKLPEMRKSAKNIIIRVCNNTISLKSREKVLHM